MLLLAGTVRWPCLDLCSSTRIGVPCSYTAPSNAHSKAALRLVHRLRYSNASVKTAIRHVSKATLLTTLRSLLQVEDWRIALPIYLSVSDSSWFKWNPSLLAELIALLTKHKQTHHAESLIETELSIKQTIELQRSLVQQYAKHGLKDAMLSTFQSLKQQSDVRSSLSCLLQGYVSMDLPHEALSTLRKIQCCGVKPAEKDFRAILFSFGKCGMFKDMELLASEMDTLGLLNDAVVFNMIITTYATSENHTRIKHWLDKMNDRDIQVSIRTLNAIAKACPVLTRLSTSNTYVRMDALSEHLASNGAGHGELDIVQCLVQLCLVKEVVKWDCVWQLDLHSTTNASAYVILLCWLEELFKLLKDRHRLPFEIVIVTGWGKHSQVRGVSITKTNVRDLLETMQSPFIVDSKNRGRMLAKAHAVSSWLNQLFATDS